MEALAGAGVPCGACLDTAELLHDGHLSERGFIEELDLPVHDKVSVPGFAPRLSRSRVPVRRPPRLGEHTDEVLGAELDPRDIEGCDVVPIPPADSVPHPAGDGRTGG